MCVRSFLEATIQQKQLENAYKFVLKKLRELDEQGNKYIPISYFVLRYNENSNDIYEVMNILLEYKIVSKHEFERCPQCYFDNEVPNDIDKIRCKKCKEIFYLDFITEKFKILEKEFIYESTN